VAAIGFGLLLATFALTLRASDQLITQVSLVEDLGAGQARARTFVGVLAAQPQGFAASMPAGALVRPVRETSGPYGSVSGVGGDLAQESAGLDLKIDAWQLQGVAVEQQVALPSLEATITLDAQGERIDVKNTTGQRLRDVVAAYDERVLRLGDMEPDAQLSGHWTPNPGGGGTSISAMVFADAVAEANRPGQVPNRRIQAQQAMISAALTRGASGSDIGPLVLAWMDRSPLDVSVAAPNAASQSLTLLVARARVTASGPLTLNAGWLRADPGLSQRSVCRGGPGVGLVASPSPVLIVLSLPDDLAPMRAKTATISLESANTWPNAGVTTEIYDWGRRAWVAQGFDGPGELALADAAPYLFEGRLQLRLSGPMERAGCISVSAKLQGDMP
jgi:hypothetical protein